MTLPVSTANSTDCCRVTNHTCYVRSWTDAQRLTSFYSQKRLSVNNGVLGNLKIFTLYLPWSHTLTVLQDDIIALLL
jgi:hypothetical protein